MCVYVCLHVCVCVCVHMWTLCIHACLCLQKCTCPFLCERDRDVSVLFILVPVFLHLDTSYS